MTAKLIYHSDESYKQNISPFDTTIRGLVTDQDISIVCPYLGVEYLEKIIALSKSWLLLTDVEEWFAAHEKSVQQLSRIFKFIKNHIEHIRHYPDIHAKVIIAHDEALVGSANLTKKGIQLRQEMSVVIKDSALVDELSTWFNKLWGNSIYLDNMEIEKIDAYLKNHLQTTKAENKNVSVKLKLRMPENIPDLPQDVYDGQFFTISLIASRIADADEEDTLQESVRRWIYYMINHGKIRAYGFEYDAKYIQLLDAEAVKRLWQFRSQIQEGGRNTDISNPKNVIEVPKNQLLTIRNVAFITGKSVQKIKKMVENKRIQPKLIDKRYIAFDPTIIEQIELLPPEPSGHERDQANLKPENKKFLRPYTPLEKFVLETLSKENLSDQQVIDTARKVGLTTSTQRERTRQIYRSAIQKRNLYEQMGTSSEEIEKSGRQIRIGTLNPSNLSIMEA